MEKFRTSMQPRAHKSNGGVCLVRHIYHQNVKYALCNVELHMTGVVSLGVIE